METRRLPGAPNVPACPYEANGNWLIAVNLVHVVNVDVKPRA
jgi:hypothetical protein